MSKFTGKVLFITGGKGSSGNVAFNRFLTSEFDSIKYVSMENVITVTGI